MTAGYDEWAAARVPSLFAFAAALADDDESAESAVTATLARMRASWPQVSRDDPDLEARRQVARTCGSPGRAAVVLRMLEQRSDAEIAEVLRCSASAARRLLRRGLAAAPTGDVVVRPPGGLPESMVARAGSAPTLLLSREPAALPPHRGRHRGPWVSALAVLALVAGTAYAAHVSRTHNGVITYPKVVPPSSWRYESYAGVEVRVPDTWGWGGSPLPDGDPAGVGHLSSCGADQAAVLSPADHASYVSMLTGFVGRPAMVSQRCVPWGSDGSTPRGDAVWFASPLPVGQKVLGATVAETRAVGGQHVTVFSASPALRRQVLGTAAAVDVDGNGCPTRPVVRPTRGPRDLRPDTLSICVYSQDTGVSRLLYSAAAPAVTATAYAGRVAAATPSRDSCPIPSGGWVALGLTGDEGARWDVANLRCDRIELSGGRAVTLTPDTVREWAVGGVMAYLSAPPAGARALQEFFRAPVA